ncbi:MAG: amidohydrolase [Eubacterium sp.]|nr:amidohydrolase [Eubacterium sp.]MCM1214399.1 amidohydrolase [Lachnospiraceae bacterium]MCM1304480.1 amidohydrolase [Butyrivibrio sp.]MCM1342598.1 amidohydrolase [Muribaculaceae bacterium]MCM1238689.1 amidohydrolase [Lachnospiraceae bacterium]
MNIRLYNARILTMEKNKPVFRGEIWVKNEKIAYIASQEELAGEWAKDLPRIQWDIEIDCKDNLLMPGFKDAHTHSAMTFLRSYADDVPLDKWLNEKVFPLEAKLSGEDIYHLTRLAILEYLTAGITSIFEMYLTPDTIAEACMDMGMRCVLTSGLNNFSSSIEQLEEEYLKWNKRNSLISYQLGFHAEYTCSKELIYNISKLAHEYHAPVYTHLAETAKEVEECKARYGMTPVMFLDTMGVFEFGGGGYHCVHVNDSDMEVLRRRRMYVITNPASNLKLASGIAPIADFERRKIPVAIGTDGPASNNCLDMFREMFLVAGLSRVREGDASSPDAMKVLRMATVQGARAMHLSKADVLAKGKYADIIMIDLHQPNMQPIHNIPKNLVYSGSKSNVCMTMINGKILYRNGEFNIGDSVESIYAKCDEIVKRLINA